MLLLPLIYFIIFKYVPIFGNVLAFRRYRPGLGAFGTEWVGLRYFTMFFKDPAFWRAFRNTLTLSLMNLLINFPIPIIFALLLNEIRSVFFKKFVQTVSYMPRFISTVVVIAMAAEILSPSTGILNLLLKNTFDMQPIYFMNEPAYFRTLYIFTDTWQYMGWTAIIYLAAITGINEELYEAAKVDGANTVQTFTKITLPYMLYVTTPYLIVTFTGNINNFNVIYLLSGGDPVTDLSSTAGKTDLLVTWLYKLTIDKQYYNIGAVIGIMTFVILAIGALFTYRNSKSYKEEGGF